MFRLLAQEVPAAELTEVRRFDAPWEAAAPASGCAPGTRPRSPSTTGTAGSGAPTQEAACDRAAAAWLADHLRGKDVLLLAGSNDEAADLSRRVQARLIQVGTRRPRRQAALADGNQAGPGDLVRARLNTEIDAGGRKLTNRDTLKITAIRGDRRRGAAAAAGRHLDPAVPGSPDLPRPPAPNSATPATCTSPRAAPSTPPTSWSPTRCPGRPCTSA